MFITNPSFKANFSNGMRAVGTIYWRAAEVALARPWFVVTIGHLADRRRKKAKDQDVIGTATYVMAEAHDVAEMQGSPPEGSVVLTVQAVCPPPDAASPDWKMERVQAIWRSRPSCDPDTGRFIYEVIETIEGRLIPCFPVDTQPSKEALDLVVKFPG